MGEWMPTRLADVADVKHGFAFKGEYFYDEPPGDFLLTPGNFAIGGGFQWGKKKFYRGPVPEEFILSPGDLLVTMTDLSKEADTLGYCAVVPKSTIRLLHNQRLGKVEIRNKLATKSFLHWLLRSPEYRNEILASYTGSTVKHTSPKKILDYKFFLPSIDEQRTIAGLLDCLEQKIELNRRMNGTLEAMAQAIFKDWFVDFGPTRAKAEGRPPYLAPDLWALFPDALDDDDKPVGWEFKPVGQVVEFNPSESLSKGSETLYLDMAALPTQGSWPEPPIQRPFASGSKFRDGDTLLARITPCLENGKTAFLQCLGEGVVGWGSTEFIVLRPKEPFPVEYGYLLARDEGFRDRAIQSMTGTSGRQRVQTDSLAGYEVILPGEPVLHAFGNLVHPWFEMIRANAEQSQTLAGLRDLLLPKLMSGEIRLRDAEKAVEAVA